MDLKSGMPFWLIKDGLRYTYPKLDKNILTDVVIIGGGISGALVRFHLIKAGINCVLIDARTIGLGSTSASTSLLQYEIDTPLHQLIDISGKANAERAFHLCNDAIDQLKKIAKEIRFEDFETRDSVYFGTFKKDIPFLSKEFEARKNAGFDVEWLSEKDVHQLYGFKASAAILSRHGAQTNAYGFTQQLLQYHSLKENAVFDRSPIKQTEHQKSGLKLTTDDGYTIKAKKIVYAIGYEVVEMLNKKIVELKSTYAIISEQFNHPDFWTDNALLWNTQNPYLYLRTTNDGRILIGGRDEEFHDGKKRDALISKKSRQLCQDFNKLFPDIPFKTEFRWAGTFGETKDGLPYIGQYPKTSHSYFSLGFGGNGITFSLIAAEIITDMILGKANADATIFSFDRKIYKR